MAIHIKSVDELSICVNIEDKTLKCALDTFNADLKVGADVYTMGELEFVSLNFENEEEFYKFKTVIDRIAFEVEHKEEEKRKTCLEIFNKEHTDGVNLILRGRCNGCPYKEGYIYSKECFCAMPSKRHMTDYQRCTACWNQVATKYYDERMKQDDKN